MAVPTFAKHECDKCTLTISTKDMIIPREVLKKVNREPIFVGLFTRLGCPGHSHFFVFKCSRCRSTVVDYARGYTRDGSTLFLEHRGCPRPTVTIEGVGITHWTLDERNLKELEESISHGGYAC